MALPRLSALALLAAVTGPAALHAQGADEAPDVDLVVVHKAARQVVLYSGERAVRLFEHIQLGEQPLGAKHFQGDGRTPEGRYTIDYANPASSYHLSLHISYPATRDLAFAYAAGRTPGGQIFLHGQPNQYGGRRVSGDWTDGCIALSDAEIEELWALVPDGTPIDITP